MTVLFGEFQMPTEIEAEKEGSSSLFTRFKAGPFERGLGHTIGNSLRRLLLSCLEAPAIIAVRIADVPHEYMAIEGVIEDMTNIILNFKGALLRKLPLEGESYAREPRILTTVIDVTDEMLALNKGQYEVTLGDLLGSSAYYEVINPNLRLFTVTQPMKKQVDLRVAIGRGYQPSERIELEDKRVDEIAIDACFSPVRLVNYHVENTRVGQHTDFDQLILEVTTDGRITPTEALSFVSQIAIKHYEVFGKIQSHMISFDQYHEGCDSDRDLIMQKLAKNINEIELSVRSMNCLNGAEIETIAELVVRPEPEMLKFRNFGKKSLNEIKAKLEEMGLYLGMDLGKYGINKDNARQVIQNYLEENNSGS